MKKWNSFKWLSEWGLSGDNEQKLVLILHGCGTNNGKSTTLKIIEDLGGGYACGVREGVIDQKTNEGQSASPDTAKMKGERFVILRELSQSTELDASKVKRFAGNDHTPTRGLYAATESFVPQCLILMDCNTLPSLDDMTLFDRESLFVITFEKGFRGEQRDTSVARKLEKEHAGILNWILEGFQMYCERYPDYTQIKVPECIQKDTMDYRYEYDQIKEYLECCLDYTGDPKDRIITSAMRQNYEKWVRDNGYQRFSVQKFNAQLQNLLNADSKTPKKRKDFKIHTNGKVYYQGFRFKIHDVTDPSGFTTYLETEYQKSNVSKDHANVPLASLFNGYRIWADEQGICDKIDFYDTVKRLQWEKYPINVEDNQIVISGIEKVVHDSEVCCESNQLTM